MSAARAAGRSARSMALASKSESTRTRRPASHGLDKSMAPIWAPGMILPGQDWTSHGEQSIVIHCRYSLLKSLQVHQVLPPIPFPSGVEGLAWLTEPEGPRVDLTA